jgi:CubicO group peptidase (beta-lactamase class C family)
MKKTFKILGMGAVAVILLVGIALVGLYLAAPKPAIPPKNIQGVGDLDAYFEKLTANQTPPALTVTVLKKGVTVYAKAFGYADRPQKIPAQVNTIYPWWSVTKVFTAAAIMQLYEQGLVDLDDPVQSYLPYFNVTGKDGSPKKLTIRHLLTHRSGLRDLMPEGLTWIRPAGQPKPNQTAFLQEKLTGKFRVVQFEPGTRARYTNIGYIVLGVVIEAVTGQEYETYIYEHILAPLAMPDTTFIRSEALQHRTATGSNPVVNLFTGLLWVYGGKGFMNTHVRETVNGRMWFHPLYTDYTPSTGLSGSAEDMARFAQVFLSDGMLNGQRILRQATVDEMLAPVPLEEAARSYDDAQFRLGWKVWSLNEQIVYGHGGGGPGFGALLAFIPDRELVVAVNANDTNINHDVLLRLLIAFQWN